MKRWRSRGVAGLLLSAMAVLSYAAETQAGGVVKQATIRGSINPASADFLVQAIRESEEAEARALLIELDTPGGLVTATKDIIQAILNAKVPVIVYVAPRGAWASSAGTFITVAANVAAMAPGTSIGAAHPVGIGGGGGPGLPDPGEQEDGENAVAAPEQRDFSAEKAENLLAAYMETIATKRERNVEWVVSAVRDSVAIGETEALELGVIDLIAENRDELLKAVNGREVELGDGRTKILDLEGAAIEPIEMSTLQSLFNFLADPNVAMVLFLAGMLGLYVEVNNPGLLLPGMAGAVCLILAAIAFQILPFSWVGLLLIALGIGLLVAEVFVPSFGVLFAMGLACFMLGGTMVFDRPDLSDLTVSFWSVLVPAVAALAIFGGIVVLAVGRSLLLPYQSGVDELVGSVGTATTPIGPKGIVFIRGEYWNVASGESIPEGDLVEVVSVEGLKLRVRRAVSGAS